jgi:hypothetical protein
VSVGRRDRLGGVPNRRSGFGATGSIHRPARRAALLTLSMDCVVASPTAALQQHAKRGGTVWGFAETSYARRREVGMLVGRVERACGDGLSAAVVAIVALVVLGEWS